MIRPCASCRRGFTLIELLVVIAIIAILAAILFPVFAQAKQAAKKTVAVSDMKQGALATQMYMGDNNDSFPMSDTGSIGGPGWGYGPPDTVPFQVMQPYCKNTRFEIDPMDPWQNEDQRIADQCRYMSCTLATATAEQKSFALGVRSNMGYNFTFSPWIYNSAGYVGSASVSQSDVTSPAHTLQFGTSIWYRVGGAPTGGGNWVLQNPCWYDVNGQLLAPFNKYLDYSGAGLYYKYGDGWNPDPQSWDVYGGLWPFYNQTDSKAAAGAQNGRVVVGWADGHVTTMTISQSVDGCSAYGGAAPATKVTDASKYIWAIQQP